MSNTPDLSKLVQLIMENPQLIEEISNLAQNSAEDQASEKTAEQAPEPTIAVPPTPPPQAVKTVTVAEPAPVSAKVRRTQLLGALKPYVSEERAKAIDSMLSIAEILDMMRTR